MYLSVNPGQLEMTNVLLFCRVVCMCLCWKAFIVFSQVKETNLHLVRVYYCVDRMFCSRARCFVSSSNAKTLVFLFWCFGFRDVINLNFVARDTPG